MSFLKREKQIKCDQSIEIMLPSFHIKNYRLFKDMKIDSLKRVNLIVGKNNVGKTSLLEALWLFNNRSSLFLHYLYFLMEKRGEWETSNFDVSYMKAQFRSLASFHSFSRR